MFSEKNLDSKNLDTRHSMDVQRHIRVYSKALSVKGPKGKLLRTHSDGY